MKDLKIFTTNIEQEAVNQINELLKQEPFKNCKVRIMPDVHAGKGCVIGFTADLGEKVIPNIVGVDIGCGMLCVELGNIELDFKDLDRVVNEYIPAGRNIRKQKLLNFDKINELYCLRELKETKKFNRAIGTLGGGNHFIEIDADNKGNKYLVIHTGSRNLGKQVADYYQNLAIELCSGKEEMYKKKEEIIKKYKEQGRKSEIQQALKELEKEYKNNKPNLPKELCYLEGKHREMYLHDMKICQEYASLNRLQIAKQIIINYYKLTYIPEMYPLIMQNSFETIIPINMRDGSIIAVGKGNQDWNCSAPHGAGRIMSRTKAKERFKLEEFKQSMKDVYSTSVVEETIDESPMVYKSMQEIIENTKDTIEIQKTIRPIYNFKAKN